MNHYQKLATMIFRIIGAFLILFGILLVLMPFALSILGHLILFGYFTPTAVFGILLLILGIVLFASSKFLAKIICFDFDKSNEK